MADSDGAFVANVSHELRTPLTTIQMAAEVIFESRSEFGADVRRAAELLYAQVERFELLLADLLEMSRFDSGEASLVTEDLDLRTLVGRVVADLTPMAAAASVQLTVEAPEAEVVVDVDRVRVERVLRNLIVNAVTHGGGGAVRVLMSITRPGEVLPDSGFGPGKLPLNPAAGVLISVVDSGPGLPAEPERVFDRFWRADPSRARDTGGAGLGLAIAAEDTALHGGVLRAQGNEDGGSTFLVWLPGRIQPVSTDSP